MIEDVLKAEPAIDFPNSKQMKLDAPELLKWSVDAKVEEALVKAEQRGLSCGRETHQVVFLTFAAEKDIADVDSVLLHFGSYGSEQIKKIGMSGLWARVCVCETEPCVSVCVLN